MFQHILLATDFSDTSEGAFRVATDLARTHLARLTVLHVLARLPRHGGA